MPIQTVGMRIRHARTKLRNMTQKALATAADVEQPSISELETGETKEISGPVLVAVSKALGVRPEWIITGEEPIEPTPATSLSSDELEMLQLYRAASHRWRVALKYMAKLRGDAEQDLAAESMNVVLAKIAAQPVPDYKLGDQWTRPDRRKRKDEGKDQGE